MSVHSQPRVLTFYAGSTGIVKGCVVKPGADGKHVLISAAATSLNIGFAMNAAAAAGDKVEVALPGGGAKALVGSATPAFGDLLTADANGAVIVTTTPGDRYIAIAMEAGVVGDLIAVEVVAGLI